MKFPTAMVLVALVGVAAGAQGDGGHSMRVELDLFSGRPNPGWTLTAAEGAELEAMTASLPIMVKPPPRFDGLGYRGIVVRKPADPGWSLVAFRDTVRVRSEKGSEVRADPDAAVERWLLRKAGDAVDPDMLARIGY